MPKGVCHYDSPFYFSRINYILYYERSDRYEKKNNRHHYDCIKCNNYVVRIFVLVCITINQIRRLKHAVLFLSREIYSFYNEG